MSYDGIVLKKRRKQLGLTLQDVADKAGIDIKQYQRFEAGDRELASASFITTVQVIKALELDPVKYATGEYEIIVALLLYDMSQLYMVGKRKENTTGTATDRIRQSLNIHPSEIPPRTDADIHQASRFS